MPNNFRYRSNQKEMLDEAHIPRDLLFKNLQELDWLNRFLGGHSITLEGIRQLIHDPEKVWNIADLGCGSGDSLLQIAKWAKKNHLKVSLTGVDLNPAVIDFLKDHCREFPEIRGFAGDYREFLATGQNIDIIHCSLFCHHLNDQELTDLLLAIKQKVTTGFVINDLQRSRIAYFGVWLLTRILNATVLSKHDGPVSVQRAFKKKELEELFNRISLRNYSVRRRWAFRYLIIGKL